MLNQIKNWKTTVTVLIGAIASVSNALFGWEIPQEAIITVVVFVIGFFAKDADKTGVTSSRKPGGT